MDFGWQSDVSAFEYSKFIIAFLSRNKSLNFMSAMILETA